MSICNVSEIWQNQSNSESNLRIYPTLLDSLCPYKPLDFATELQFKLQEEPNQVQKQDPIPIEHPDMLSDQLKSSGMSECLNSNFTLNNSDIEQDSNLYLGDFPDAQYIKKSRNSTAKNILGYQTRKVIKMMLSYQKPYLTKKCKASGINFREFKRYFIAAEKKLYGPVSLDKLFNIDQENPKEAKMKKIFLVVFHKLLRKGYLIYSLKLGKMQDHTLYIQEKNRKLLYYTSLPQML